MKKIISLSLSLLLFTFSCSDDDPVNIVTLEDLTVAVNENPTNGQVLGSVEAIQTIGGATLAFSITSQTPSGALAIDASSGELTVADASLFDFETNSTITAQVTVDGVTSPANISINLNDVHEIGEFKFGGVIFWIDPTSANSAGLVCAVTDQSLGIQWYNGSNGNTGAVDATIGAGQANTTAIVNYQGTGSYAAMLCDELSLNGYNDWFLPSIGELEEIYNNKVTVNATCVANSGIGFEEGGVESNYWSSTQVTNSRASIIRFNDGFIQNGYKSTSNYNVRAVRAWTDF